MTHRRTPAASDSVVAVKQSGGLLVEKSQSHDVLLTIQGKGAGDGTLKVPAEKPAKDGKGPTQAQADLSFSLAIPAGGARELLVKLPSPLVSGKDRDKLLALDYAAARAATIKFWSDYLRTGPNSASRKRRSTNCSVRVSGAPCACRGGTEERGPACKSTCPTPISPTISAARLGP